MGLTAAEQQKYFQFLDEFGNEDLAFMQYTRWKCLTDLYWFGSEFYGWKHSVDPKNPRRKRVDPVFHKWLANEIQRTGDKLILVPRLHLKSTWVKLDIVRKVLMAPNKRIGLFSVASRLVEKELVEIKHMFQKPELRELFPDLVPDPGKEFRGWEKCTANELTLKRDKTSGEKIPQESQVTVLGSGARMAGLHMDTAYLDDIVDQDSVKTPELIKKTLDWWGYIQSIMELGAEYCITGTRYGRFDLYHTMIEEKQIEHVVVRKAIEQGKVLYHSWFTKKELAKIKRRQGNYIFSCNPGYAPIWMSDYSFKELKDIKVGDEVIGYEIHAGEGKRRKLVKSKVEEVNSRIAETVKVTMESGRELICTADHAWFTGRNGTDEHSVYLPAKEGRPLISFIDPTEKPKQDEWIYLAGMIDGEGGCKYGSICITQSKEANPGVYKKLTETINKLKLDVKVYRDSGDREDDVTRKSADMFVLNGGRQTKIDILRYGNPGKKDQIIQNLWDKPGMKSQKDKVISIQPHKREKVFALKTTTGNYVAWGYASKNCQYLLDPVAQEDKIFPGNQPTYHKLPPGDYNWYMTVDPAPTIEGYSDETGITIGAVDKRKFLWIHEAIGVKKSGGDLADLLIRLAVKYRFTRIGIEFGLQTHLQYILDHQLSEYERNNGVRVPFNVVPVPISRKQSKGDRVYLTLGSFIREGKCFVKEDQVDLIHEMDFFTGKGKEKDNLVDAAAMLFFVIEDFNPGYMTRLNMRPKGTFRDIFDGAIDDGYKWRKAFNDGRAS